MKNSAIFSMGSIKGAPHCHSSNIIELPDNMLFTTWWGGTAEKERDCKIYGAFYNLNNSSGWTVPKVVANTPDHFNGTPVSYLTPPPENRLFLFFRKMHHGRLIHGGHTTTSILYQTSEDLGNTWSPPQVFRKLWGRVIRCKCIRLNSGRVILPFHREMFQYQSRFYINEDPHLKGRWRTVGRVKVPGGCLEPSVCELEKNRVVCSLRAYNGKRVYITESLDGGITWKTPWRTNVPNPNSQTELLRISDGSLIMACNPTESEKDILSIIRSTDGGKTWGLKDQIIVEDDRSILVKYPCLLLTSDKQIHMTYTYGTGELRTIKHFTCLEKELWN